MYEIPNELLKQYFSCKYNHALYKDTMQKSNAMSVHADGLFPEELIGGRRPNEAEEAYEYRKQIYVPYTKGAIGRVLNVLNKIRRSSEWNVNFDNSEVPASIAEGETLEDYTIKKYPIFTSTVNWIFDVLLRSWAIDANGFIGIMPYDEEVKANEYVRPFANIHKSESIIECIPDEYVVVKSDEKCTYLHEGNYHTGDIYIIYTNIDIQRWEQTGPERAFRQMWNYAHNLNYVPCFKMHSIIDSMSGKNILNNSRLEPMLAGLDEAVREYSDLQAEVVLHMHSEKWELGQTDSQCLVCNGTGQVSMPGFNTNNIKHVCNKCNGHGFRRRGPYETMMIAPPMSGEAILPTPPMGYVQKNTDIVKLQSERVDTHIYNALSNISMEHLFTSPLAQSGIAKAYDADEANNFVHACAEDLVSMLDKTIAIICDMRYIVAIPDYNTRCNMLPIIAVPESYEIFSAQVQQDKLLNAKSKNINPIILNAMETEYVSSEFSSNAELRDMLTLALLLDPLANVPEDQKVMRLQNGGITKETYIISSNITSFINRALDMKGNDFYDMDIKEQKKLMISFAQEQISSTSTAKQILTDIIQP